MSKKTSTNASNGRAATTAVLEKPTLESFASSLLGQLLQSGDAEYDQVRKVYNGGIDRKPRYIVRCADAADVMQAVNFAREHQLTLSVRGGSHNPNGFAVNNGGLVIDLSRMRGVRVNPRKRTAQVEGGATWGDFDHATHGFGLATTGGILSTTGVGGLTLGGGIGYLARKCGLSLDNLISADVVTADGQFLTASERQHEDLFWALRGGGGNFGIVTSFEFKLHPVGIIIGGPIFYPIERSKEALEFYRDYMHTAPEEFGGFFAFVSAPPAPFIPEHMHLKPYCAVVVCYTGSPAAAEKVLKPLRTFGPPALDLCGPMPYPALQSMFTPLYPAGIFQYWKADFTKDISDGEIQAHLKHGPKVPAGSSTMHIYPI